MVPSKVSQEVLSASCTYAEYRLLIEDLLFEGKTTGNHQLETLVEETRLNQARMKWLDKVYEVNAAQTKELLAINRHLCLLTITEGWSGDAAQIVPIIEKLSATNNFLSHRILLHHQHPQWFSGLQISQSAPPLPICLVVDVVSLQVIAHWGSRPLGAQMMLFALKNEPIDGKKLQYELHSWYLKDKGQEITHELIETVKRGVESIKFSVRA